MTTSKIDLTEQHVAAQDQPKPRGEEFGRQLDAFIAARRKTPVLPMEAMTRESIYGPDAD